MEWGFFILISQRKHIFWLLINKYLTITITNNSSLTHPCKIKVFSVEFFHAFDNSVLIKKQQSSSQYPFLFQEFSEESVEVKAFENPSLFICFLDNDPELWKYLYSPLFTGEMLLILLNLVSPASI